MKKEIVLPGQGKSYDWAKDHVFVKSALTLSEGRLTLVEDHLKPGFFLARHHHKKMIEIFYVLDGEVEFKFDDEAAPGQPATLYVKQARPYPGRGSDVGIAARRENMHVEQGHKCLAQTAAG